MTFFTQKRPRYGEDPNFIPNTIIGEGVTVMGGVIKGINSVMVSGLVFCDINVDGEVIITETGYVKGNIVSTFAVIAGIVEGDINLSSYASLKSTASVTGDINCTAISVDDGAIFSGSCNMTTVKNSIISKKMKRINEQATATIDEKSKLLREMSAEDLEDEPAPENESASEADYEENNNPQDEWYSLDDELAEDDPGEKEKD